MMDRLYEHLITKRKYNTLENKYETLRLELDRKGYELTLEKRVREKQIGLFDERLKEILEENIKLKEQITKLKKEIKELKK
jgi:hypothetical protein